MTEQEFRSIYPPEIMELMLQRQEEQRNPRSIEPFLKNIYAGKNEKGFTWIDTPERWSFWDNVLMYKNFKLFYDLYPKINNTIILLL